MLKRDIYISDYTTKYYSRVSQTAFYNDTAKHEYLRYHLFKGNDTMQHGQLQSKKDVSQALSIVASLLTVLNYSKLPLVQFRNKWLIYFTKVSIVLLPFSAVHIVIDEQKQKQLWDMYIQNFGRYIIYKQTGDIKHIDNQLKHEGE